VEIPKIDISVQPLTLSPKSKNLNLNLKPNCKILQFTRQFLSLEIWPLACSLKHRHQKLNAKSQTLNHKNKTVKYYLKIILGTLIK